MNMKHFGMGLLALALSAAGAAAWAQNVKITPLGTHPGELCDRDRATIFEDPDRRAYPLRCRAVGNGRRRPAPWHHPCRAVVPCAYRSHRRPQDRRAQHRLLREAGNGVGVAEFDHGRNCGGEECLADHDPQHGVLSRQENSEHPRQADRELRRTRRQIAAVQEAPCLAPVELGGTKIVKAAGAASGVEITTVYAVTRQHALARTADRCAEENHSSRTTSA